MTGKFQGRHIRSHVQEKFYFKPMPVSKYKCQILLWEFSRIFLSFVLIFLTCSFLWSLICFCLVVLHFQMQDFDLSSCSCLWLYHGFHTYITVHAHLCFPVSQSLRMRHCRNMLASLFLQSEAFMDLEWYLLVFWGQGYESWMNPTLALTLTAPLYWTRHFMFLHQFLFLQSCDINTSLSVGCFSE